MAMGSELQRSSRRSVSSVWSPKRNCTSMSQIGLKPVSRNNQAHLKDKSSARQSLSVALTASSAQFDRDRRDRNVPEETMTQAQAIRQDAPAHQGAPAIAD